MNARAALAVAALGLVALAAEAAPRARHHAPPADVEVDVDVTACGAPPPADARWFYLGAPGDRPAATAARRALRAVIEAFDCELQRDPRCLHVEVLDDDALEQRYKRFGRRGPDASIVGFHNPKLGADTTVFVVPQPGQGLDVVILHEVLHALSHRFSSEASRRRLNHLVEGATEYLTRELAEVSLGVPRRAFKTGYGLYVAFYDALMARLGKEGPALLGGAYLGDGYDDFEREVDARLGPRLRSAGHALESDDLREALQRLSARATDGATGRTSSETSSATGGR